jgi:single-stranded DNA-binding protein
MEFEGVVFRKLPEISGTSAKGTWRKQNVVFELPSEFNRKICVSFFGDRAEDAANLNEGDAVNVSVNVESREYNGKWYTDVRAWKVVRGSGTAAGAGSGAGYGHGAGAGFGPDSGSGPGAGPDFGAGASQPRTSNRPADAPGNPGGEPAIADDVDDLPF